jgi:hypothetical protein
MADRDYPVPRPPEGVDDSRFTFGLVAEVRDVLTKHGFPRACSGGDLLELEMALFGFVYGPHWETGR